MPKVIQVIETQETIGSGTPNDPLTRLNVYYSLDGEWLASDKEKYEPAKEPVKL